MSFVERLRGEDRQSLSKQEFFVEMSRSAVVLDRVEYAKIAGSDSRFASYTAELIFEKHKRCINMPQIYVNHDDFSINGQDYSHFMPLPIRHEAAELWFLAKPGYPFSPNEENLEECINLAHQLAQREEFVLAFSLGVQDEYLNFLQRYSEGILKNREPNLLLESTRAYRNIKRRLDYS